MHPNPSFRSVNAADNLAFARGRAFGVVAINGPDGPICSHVPFLVSDDGQHVEGHFVRSNPIVATAGQGPMPAVLAVSGPDGYISPDWYGIEDQVPTWNYIAVHLRGDLRILGPDALTGHLTRLSHQFEHRLLPKPEWLIDKVEAEALERLKRMIVPFSLQVTKVDGTWKLNQNKGDAVREAAARGLCQSDIGHELSDLGHLMENLPR